MRGASRGVFEVEQDTAPAALLRKQDSGGRGSASGLTTKPCHWLADAGQAAAAQAAMPRAFQTDARTSPKARSSARNRRGWSAAKRCAAGVRVSQPGWSRRHTPHVAPCGAPSPLNSEGDQFIPRSFGSRDRGGVSCMKGCLKFGQGLRRNALAALNAVRRKLDPRIHHLRESLANRMDGRDV